MSTDTSEFEMDTTGSQELDALLAEMSVEAVRSGQEQEGGYNNTRLVVGPGTPLEQLHFIYRDAAKPWVSKDNPEGA